jgi:uncharacterized phage protein (TIGR01671 family)
MKREILFRGKCPTSGEWFFGFYFIDGFGNHCITDNKCNLHEVDPETVGQYTGLKDKNGVKIFEGDILNGRHYTNIAVEWDERICSFIMFDKETELGYSCTDGYAYEVTSNIHED